MLWNRLTKPRPRRTTRWRPHLDPLEDRTLLSMTTFSVDDTRSSLTLSGSAGGQMLQEQMPGSLVTAYMGSFLTDVDFTKAQITFVPSAQGILAENSGDWQPRADGSAGAEPANYGGQINLLGTALVAIRNLEILPSSDPLPLTALGEGMSYSVPNNQHLKIHGGQAAYSHPLLGHGTKHLGKLSSDNQADSQGHSSYLVDVNGDGSLLELHLAIDLSGAATIHRFPVNLSLDGMIVATGSLGAVGPAARHAAKSTDAVLGTALMVGAHAHSQALVASSFPSLDHARVPNVQPLTFGNTPNADLGSALSLASHPATVNLLDATFAELSPLEYGMM